MAHVRQARLQAALIGTAVAAALLAVPDAGRAGPAPADQFGSAAPAGASVRLATGERVQLVPRAAEGGSPFRVLPATPGARVGGYAFGSAGGRLRVQPVGRSQPVPAAELAIGAATARPAAAARAAEAYKVTFTMPPVPGAEQKLVNVWNRAGWVSTPVDNPERSTSASAVLPPGDYLSIALISSWRQPSYLLVKTFTVANAAVRVAFDARGVKETRIAVDAPAAREAAAIWISVPGGDVAGFAGGYDGTKVYVSPFSLPGVSLRLHEILTRPGTSTLNPSPYRYDVYHSFDGTVPATPVANLSTARLARTYTTVRGQGTTTDGTLQSVPVTGDWTGAFIAGSMPVPGSVTEYVTPDRTFSRLADIGGSEFRLRDRALAPGVAPGELIGAGPIAPREAPSTKSDRYRNTLFLYEYPAFSDAAGNAGIDRTALLSARLSSAGATLAELSNASPYATMQAQVPAGAATYRFEHTVTRRVPWSRLATEVRSDWQFRSSSTTYDQTLPLIDVDLGVSGLDRWNTAGAGPVQVSAQATTRRIQAQETLTGLEYSTDDGASWTALAVPGTGARASATLTVAAAAAFVSLRVTAADDQGGTLTRTILRAFGGPARGGDGSAGGMTVSGARINHGRPVVLASGGYAEFSATFTVAHPAGVAAAYATLYQGAADRSTGRLTSWWNPDSCTRVTATTAACTASFTIEQPRTFRRNALAGPWTLAVVARAKDGNGFAERHAAGRVSFLRHLRLSTNAKPEPVRKGRNITVVGKLSRADWATSTYRPFGAQLVRLQFKKSGATAFSTVKWVRTDASGNLRAVVKAKADGIWRYSFPATATTPAVSNSGDYVDVR